MANNTNKKEISFIEVEEVLKKNKVRTRTLFTRKSRKLSNVLDDLAKKWSKLSKEDIENHIDDLYTELKDPSQLDWMLKKKRG